MIRKRKNQSLSKFVSKWYAQSNLPVSGGKKMPESTVYGPVASWRLGRSLGIDLLNGESKICNFDCIYCQLGSAAAHSNERQEFVSLEKLSADLTAAKDTEADYATFSGMGEPTLAANLGAAIEAARDILGLPVAVITNASLLPDPQVRRELALADLVIVKLDAADEAMFQRINQPNGELKLAPILQAMQLFRLEYKGKLMVDIMWNDFNKPQAYHLNYLTKMIMPDGIYLNTPRRPAGCQPVTATEIANLRKTWFWNQPNVMNVFERNPPAVTPRNVSEAELRHPTGAGAQPTEKTTLS
jgi:wyosine [tRNA(Phe)-imidazoG37] synthetase (radical SAM superfamily)